MKKVVLGIVLLLILAIGGTFFYVISIDWNKHKNKISEQFYNSTGKHIAFVGNVSFKIFPTPYLNAINAKIYNSENKNEKPLLDIRNINAELSLLPLLKGEVNINKMTLDGVTVNINWDSKGLNWQGDLSADQRQMMQDTNMVLNSVSLKDATVNFEAANGDVNFTLNKLNGEVMAQSVFGPFRIEGNYMKGDVPQGFAVTIGKMEDSMPTSLNAVFTHPKSSSYIRFDGSFQLDNRVLNGNVVVESQKLSDFVNENTEKVKIREYYNKPLILGFDVAVNKQMINLSNIVMKYEETQGAGSIQIPNTNLSNPNIKANFEFADLALEPFVDSVKAFVKKYNEEIFNPNIKMKLTANIKSIRASYEGQIFKDLVSSFEINDKGFLLEDLNIVLPGNTAFNMKGNLYSYDDEAYYQADVSLSTEELMKLLKWIKLEPKATATSVYRKMLLTAKLAGNFDKFQISPYKVVLDNTTFNGDAGFVFGERKDIMLNVNADTLNFDNYINSIPEEIKAKSFADRLRYRFSKLGMFNDFDMVLNANANLVIYEGLPFEKVKFKGNILQSNLELDQVEIGNVANTSFKLKGKVSGFGSVPSFDNLEYNIEAQDVPNMIEKLGLYDPEFDYNRFYNLAADGTINGTLDNFGINTQISSGDLNANYVGTVELTDKAYFDGNVELKHSEVMNFIEGIGLDYKPQSPNLGLFRLKSNIKGTLDNLTMSAMELNAGYSQFSGDLSYDFRGDKKIADAKLKINKIELEKYLVRENNKIPVGVKLDGGIASFLSKPSWNKDRIDYTPYKDLEVKGDLDIGEMSYKSEMFNDAKFKLNIKDGLVDVSDFTGIYKNTPIKAGLTLNMSNDPIINATIDMAEANLADFSFGGKTYSLKDGKFSAKINLASKASSEENFINNLNGTIDFQASGTNVNGFNIKNIYDDIVKRNKSEGLVDFANSQIASGSSSFDKIIGKINIADGDFRIAESKLEAPNTNVALRGNGSLKNWTMDVLFDVKHNEPKHLENYTISMKNSMDNPDVTIDVSKLFGIFKAKEEQKQAEEKAQAEAQKMMLSQQINEQKKIAEDLVKSTKEKMNLEIDNKIKGAFSDNSSKMYEEVKAELDTLLTSFLDSTLVINSDEATQDKIDTLKDLNTKAIQNIELLKNKTEQIHLNDLQIQNSSEYEKIVEVNDELKKVVADYNAMISNYNSRLANIITEYKLITDEKYVTGKKQIDDTIADLEKLNNDVVTARNLHSTNGTIAEYEELNVKMRSVLEKIVAGKEDLETKVKALKESTEEVISREENAYHKKIEDEENQRLIEENTGSISVKKTGKKMTVRRDIEDIREANEDISNEAVKVIDFTKKKVSTEKTSATKNSGVIKKGRINR